MSLVEKAKKKAQEAADQKKKEAEQEVKFKAALASSLTKMTRQVLSGLREFHGVQTRRGTLRLVRKQKKPHDKTVAVLRLIRPKGEEPTDLLYVDAAIESGTRCYSDDCQDVPYTESVVRVYVKETNSRNRDNWSYGPYHPNYAVWGLGLKEFFSEYFTNWNDDDFKKKMDGIAEWIAPLFSEK